MVAVASAAVVFNVVLGLCLHGACCSGLPHGHSHGGHTRLTEEGDADLVDIRAKETPGHQLLLFSYSDSHFLYVMLISI
jgi:hypothetical protein